ncbi:MAG: sigma-70 family RNA polymerase sigma factor [Nannocystaceae bacterium]|nr:sigma-70 family RNA polymerase sigma factor [Nannocystaceae bacterium]
MHDDAALLSAWREGDATAGKTLVARHFPAIYRFFANKLGGDVDDLVQQTFLACVEGRDRVRDDAGFRAYLFGVARNRLMRHFRDRGGRGEPERTVDALPAATVSVAEQMAKRREQKLLLQALRRLPLDLQIAVELAYWENLSDREVAAILELPLGTFKSRLRKARMLLAEAMAELAGQGALLESTTLGLDRWVASIRAELEQASLR